MVESSWDGGGCGVEWSQGELSYICKVYLCWWSLVESR